MTVRQRGCADEQALLTGSDIDEMTSGYKTATTVIANRIGSILSNRSKTLVFPLFQLEFRLSITDLKYTDSPRSSLTSPCHTLKITGHDRIESELHQGRDVHITAQIVGPGMFS